MSGKHRRSTKAARIRRAARLAAPPVATTGALMLSVPLAHASEVAHTSPATVYVLDSVTRPAAPQAPYRPAHMQTYSLRPGDYLSLVAARYCGSADKWPDIWHATPGIANPDVVPVGLRVNISCTGNYSAPARTAAHYVARHAAGTDPWDGQHHECGDGDHDGMDMPCSYLHNGSGNPGYQPRHSYSSGRSYRHYSSYSSGSYSGGGGCQSHIIADESGGNPRAVNPKSGAGGLYQFLPSTWHGLGHSGLPQDASIAEQNQAYYQQVAQSGYSAWAASGGC